MAGEQGTRNSRSTRGARTTRDANARGTGTSEAFDDESATGAARPRTAINKRPARLSVAEAAEIVLQQIAELTEKNPEGVTSVEPGEDGTWIVAVEVLEDRHVPSSADVLALYEAELETDGTLMSYRRVRRYVRSNSNEAG